MGEVNVMKDTRDVFLDALIQKADIENDGSIIIYGIGSAEVLDSQNEIVKMDALEKSLPQLLLRQTVSFEHRDAIVGKILDEKLINGVMLKTRVDYPTEYDINFFKSMDIQLEPIQKYLFILAKIHNDNEFNKSVIQKISEDIYRMFSIAGHKIKSSYVCNKSNCHKCVEDLTLDAVTITRKGANPLAKFKTVFGGQIMEKSDEKTPVVEPAAKAAETPNTEKEYEILTKKMKEMEEKLELYEKKTVVPESKPTIVEPITKTKDAVLVNLSKEDRELIVKDVTASIMEIIQKTSEKPKEVVKEKELEKVPIQKTAEPEKIAKSDDESLIEKLNLISKISRVEVKVN